MAVDHSLMERIAAAEAARAATLGSRLSTSGGGGPYDPGMEARVAALEADSREVKAGVARLETASTRIETKMDALAGKADVAAIVEKVQAHADRLGAVETAIKGTIETALNKTLGAGSVVGMVAGIAAIGAVAAALIAWVLRHFHFA